MDVDQFLNLPYETLRLVQNSGNHFRNSTTTIPSNPNPPCYRIFFESRMKLTEIQEVEIESCHCQKGAQKNPPDDAC